VENNSGGSRQAIGCTNCHAGADPSGGYGAHGAVRAKAPTSVQHSGADASPEGPQQWDHSGTGFMNGNSWSAPPDTNNCYARNSTTTWNECTQGSHD
jgi:hypothetical protein